MKIASLEDDLDQARRIQQVLTAAGYACTSYHQSRDLLAALRTETYDLVLLDWHLPDIDGDDVVRWVRAHIGARIPVIFLTNRSAEDDLVEGLRAGADEPENGPLTQEFRVDPAARAISLDDVAISLAPKEFELALLFFRNVGRLMSRDVLAECVWNREIPATSRTLDTHLSNIRQKLQLRPQHGVRLTSSYALGYRLELVSPSDDGQNLSP